MKADQGTIICCSRCNLNVPITRSTYENGKDLICFDCYNKVVKGKKVDVIVQQAEVPNKVDYTCIACGFKFSRNKEFQFGGQCFNCGKQHVQVIKNRQEVMKDRKSLLDY